MQCSCLDLTDTWQDAASRPTLLFVHAGVTDYTLWDAQVAYFLDNGWHCLRFDIFGLGQSLLSETYLQCAVRTPVDHVGLVDELVNKVLPMNVKVIPIGLSVGGSLALNYTIYFPPRVAGVVVVAGGVRGIDIPNTVEENQLLEEADKRLEAGDMEGAAEMQVRIWGDGPLQPEGRMNKTLRARMLAWNRDIAAREVARKGSGAERTMRREPAPGMMLHEIDVPVAIAYGTLDETCTTGTMK